MSYKYCPKCSGEMRPREVEGRSRLICDACGYIYYRNPTPASAVILQRDGAVLLVRRKFAPKRGYWSLPAGFVEYDESPKQAAIRETKEETGLDVTIERLVGVYSGYDDPRVHVVLIVYEGTLVGGALQPGDDADEVRYFPFARIPENMAFKSHRLALRDVVER